MMRDPIAPDLVKSMLAPDPTPEELQKEDEEISPAIWLAAGYLGNDLSAEERLDFETRLQFDKEFQEEVEPILIAWKHAPNYLEEEPISRDEVRQTWLKFCKHVGLPAIPLQDDHDAPDPAGTSAAPRFSRKRRVLQLTGALTGILAVVLVGYVQFVGLPEWIIPGSWHTAIAPPDLPPLPVDAPPTARLRPMKELALKTGAKVQLYNGARLSWHDRADSTGTRNLYMDGGEAMFNLQGSAKPEEYRIITPSAILQPTARLFNVDASNPSQTTVQSLEARITLTSRGGKDLTLIVRPFEAGRAVFGQMPEVIK